MSKHITKKAAAAAARAKAENQQVYQQVEAAKIKLRSGDIEGATVNLMAADDAARQAVATLPHQGRHEDCYPRTTQARFCLRQ